MEGKSQEVHPIAAFKPTWRERFKAWMNRQMESAITTRENKSLGEQKIVNKTSKRRQNPDAERIGNKIQEAFIFAQERKRARVEKLASVRNELSALKTTRS